MDLERADRLVSAGIGAAIARGVTISVAVVDVGGDLVAFRRMDGAGFLSCDIAVGKAFTAAAFRRPSADMAALLDGRSDFVARLQSAAGGRLTLAMGGLPVVVDGTFVGGLGVSGGTGEEDVDIAVAALAADS